MGAAGLGKGNMDSICNLITECKLFQNKKVKNTLASKQEIS